MNISTVVVREGVDADRVPLLLFPHIQSAERGGHSRRMLSSS